MDSLDNSNTKTRFIGCYDVIDNGAFHSDYMIAITDKVSNETFYSYYEDLSDMNYIFNIIKKAG